MLVRLRAHGGRQVPVQDLSQDEALSGSGWSGWGLRVGFRWRLRRLSGYSVFRNNPIQTSQFTTPSVFPSGYFVHLNINTHYVFVVFVTSDRLWARHVGHRSERIAPSRPIRRQCVATLCRHSSNVFASRIDRCAHIDAWRSWRASAQSAGRHRRQRWSHLVYGVFKWWEFHGRWVRSFWLVSYFLSIYFIVRTIWCKICSHVANLTSVLFQCNLVIFCSFLLLNCYKNEIMIILYEYLRFHVNTFANYNTTKPQVSEMFIIINVSTYFSENFLYFYVTVYCVQCCLSPKKRKFWYYISHMRSTFHRLQERDEFLFET